MIKIDFLFVVFYGRKGGFYYREKWKRFTQNKQTKTSAKGKTGRCNIRVRHSVMSACFF